MQLLNSRIAIIVCTTATMLTGCGTSQWGTHYDKAEKALKGNSPDRLEVAEKAYMMAIETAWKDRITEKEYAPIYEKIGDVFYEEKKYEDAQAYYLRALQMGNAMKTNADKNMAQLRKLITAYEKTRDYEQASQTQDVLVHLIEFEKSPLDPAYKAEVAKSQALKAKVAQFTAPLVKPSPEQISAADTNEVEKKAKEVEQSKAAANILQGWH